MATSILRARGLTSHLLPLAAGFKQSKFRPQGREGILEKLQGFCQVLEEAVEIANKDLERLILAQQLMNRVADKCRSNASLPGLVEPIPVAPSGDRAAGCETAQSDTQGRGPDAPATGRGLAKGVDRPATLSGLGDRLAPASKPNYQILDYLIRLQQMLSPRAT